ncbi:MAG: hypothetical protein ABR529_03650 [Actinomycetota bacterium]
MSQHPLESAQLKIRRAEDHLRAFNECHQRFLDANPYRVTRELHRDGAEHVYTVEVRSRPPNYLSAIAGDFFHNLRSALDSVLYDVSVATKPALTAKERRTIGFPIALREENLDVAQMRYAPCAAQAEVKAAQPYQGEKADMHPLWLLRCFNNIDKHQQVVVVPAHAMGGSWRDSSLPDHPVESFHPVGPFEDGAELARFTFSRPEPEVDMEFAPMLDVSLGDRVLPASFDMREVLTAVRDDVLPRFAPFVS